MRWVVLIIALLWPTSAAAISELTPWYVTAVTNSGSEDITVPSGTDLAVMCLQMYTGTTNTFPAPTLEGVVMEELFSAPGSFEAGIRGCFAQVAPVIGTTTTFAWDISAANDVINGSGYIFRFFDMTTTPWSVGSVVVDSDWVGDETGSVNTIGVTVGSVSSGFVAGWVVSYTPTNAPDGNPSGAGQTIDYDDQAPASGLDFDLVHETTPGASTSTVTGTVAYGSVIVVSLQEPVGSPSSARRRMLGLI